jgi:hypothetical protein
MSCIIAGRPTYLRSLQNRNGFTMWAAGLNINLTTPGELVTTSFFTTWAEEVLTQRDELDGVKDNPNLSVSSLTSEEAV